jgi:hypothetical protein
MRILIIPRRIKMKRNHGLVFVAACLLLATALLFISCSSDDNGDSPNLHNQSYEPGHEVYDYETAEPYTGIGGKVYMAEERTTQGVLILTEETMLLIGSIDNGEIILNFPQSVDSHFLMTAGPSPEGFRTEPSDAQVWFYTDPLRLIDDNGEHIGDIIYGKIIDDKEFHSISYLYTSKDLIIEGWDMAHENTINGVNAEFKINAKRGWNKLHRYVNQKSKYALITADLSKVPGGLEWIVMKK